MKNFKSYQAERTGSEPLPDERAAAELTRKALAAYDGKSSVAVLADILTQAEAAKRNGQLSDEEIDAFYEQFAPFLEETQRKMLKSVTERLKKL